MSVTSLVLPWVVFAIVLVDVCGKGEFTLEGKAPLKTVEVAAFRMPAIGTLVMLTAKPLNRARIAKSSGRIL